MHADELLTDEVLVRRLLAAQFPHWAGSRATCSRGADGCAR
jgi:hypothetical protein